MTLPFLTAPPAHPSRRSPGHQPADPATVSRATPLGPAVGSVFHVKPRLGARILPGRRGVLLPLLAILPLLAACQVQNNPDGWATPVRAPNADTVFILSAGEGELIAYDAASEQVLWRFPDAEDTFPGLEDEDEVDIGGVYGAPLATTGEEYLIGAYADGVVYAVRQDGSSARRVVDSGARIIAGLQLVDGTVLVADTDHQVSAVDIEQPGRPRWVFDGARDEIWGTPTVADTADGPLLLVPSLDHHLYALRISDGSLVWDHETASGLASSPVVADGRVYIGGFDRMFYALDLATGDEIWRQDGRNWFWTTALVADGQVVAADLDGFVWAWDAQTGAPRWEQPYPAGDPVRAHPVLSADGSLVVVLTDSGRVHAIDRQTGASRWVSLATIPGKVYADPLAEGDTLYVSTARGELYAVVLLREEIRRVFPPRSAGA